MRKITLAIFFLISSFFILHSSSVLAVSNSEEALGQLKAAAGASGAGIGGATPTDPRVLAANIIKTALGVLGTIFLVIIIYAGFLWMTAGGEEEKTGKAKKLISNGVIGLVIILTAYAITGFIISSLVGATTGSNPYGDGANLPAPPITP